MCPHSSIGYKVEFNQIQGTDKIAITLHAHCRDCGADAEFLGLPDFDESINLKHGIPCKSQALAILPIKFNEPNLDNPLNPD